MAHTHRHQLALMPAAIKVDCLKPQALERLTTLALHTLAVLARTAM